MPTMIRYYRGDVYADLGIAPADTWEEYLEDMKVIARSRKTPFPTVTQAGATVSSVFEFLNHLASFGGELWSFDGEELVPQVDGDRALAALENYASLRTFAHPASYTYSWQDVTNDLSRGIASSAIQWDDYSYWLDDPIRSQVPRKFQYKQNPSGPHGSFSTYGGAGVGVSRYSRNPEAAWLWLQWATALGTQEAALLDVFRPFPSRKAVLELSEVKELIEKGQYPSLTVAKEVWNSGEIVALFSFPKWWHLLDILSTHISKVWQGREQPRDALTLAQNQIQSWGSLTF